MSKLVTLLVRIAVTCVLLGWIGWKTDWSAVGAAFAHLDVGCWLGAVALLVFGQAVSAKRWQIAGEAVQMPRTTWQMFRYYLIGMYFNLLLPTSVGGDVVRVWYLNNRSGQSLRATAAVLADRLSGLGVLVAMACVATFFAPESTPAWVPLTVYSIAAAGLCGVLGLAGLIYSGKLPNNRQAQVDVLWEMFRNPRAVFWTTVCSAVVQVNSALVCWLVARGLSIDVPFAYFAVLVPLVSLLTLVPITVNGMGVREESCIVFLAPFGVSKEVATTLALLWFAVHLAVSVMGGLAYLTEKKPETATEEDETPMRRAA